MQLIPRKMISNPFFFLILFPIMVQYCTVELNGIELKFRFCSWENLGELGKRGGEELAQGLFFLIS